MKTQILSISIENKVQVSKNGDLTNCVLFERKGSSNIYIQHPFLSKKLPISYKNNHYVNEAKKVAKNESLDLKRLVGVVIVRNEKIVGYGANGSKFHSENGCERRRLGIPTGQRYDLCEGCDPKNHAEAKAIDNAIRFGNIDFLKATTAYIWGHWWCCEACTKKMISVGIKKVVLSKQFTKDFLEIDQKIQND